MGELLIVAVLLDYREETVITMVRSTELNLMGCGGVRLKVLHKVLGCEPWDLLMEVLEGRAFIKLSDIQCVVSRINIKITVVCVRDSSGSPQPRSIAERRGLRANSPTARKMLMNK
jgi:hypothetical protein